MKQRERNFTDPRFWRRSIVYLGGISPAAMSKSTTVKVGEWHGDSLHIENRAAAARSTSPS